MAPPSGSADGWLKWRFVGSQVQYVTLAVFLFLVGLGVWAYQQQPAPPSTKIRLPTKAGKSGGSFGSGLDKAGGRQPSTDGETREDALKLLEEGSFEEPSSKPSLEDEEKALKALESSEGVRETDLGKGTEERVDTKQVVKDALKKLEEPSTASERALKERLEAVLGEESEANERKEEAPKKKKRKASKSTAKDSDAGESSSGEADFAKKLKEEYARPKPDYSVATVKKEFKESFDDDAKSLLCSGCKLVAARLHSELDNHDVHDQDSPLLMLEAKRRALDATCGSFRHIRVVSSDTGLRFQAAEVDGTSEEIRMEQKLCTAMLEEARFEILAKMMQAKVPSMKAFQRKRGHNWERWLCAQRTKLCKKSETKEDDEDEEL